MQRIAIIGTGNLAWHMAPALDRIGHTVAVVSRTDKDESWPVPLLDYERLVDFRPTVLILAVPDAKITSVSAKLARIFPEGVPLLHTSGATSLKKIDDRFKHRGVLWPIRSLIKGTPTSSWEDLPLVYQANTPIMIELVRNLAEALSWKTYEMNSQDRAQLHLAAVYSNNFVSWLYQISYELCEEKGIPFSVLLPIIRDTAERQTGLEPRWSQTGAAARHDKPTMEKHLKLLRGHPEFARLYRLVSHLIQEGVGG